MILYTYKAKAILRLPLRSHILQEFLSVHYFQAIKVMREPYDGYIFDAQKILSTKKGIF